MIEITMENVFGEPGPNFVWLLSSSEILRFQHFCNRVQGGELVVLDSSDFDLHGISRINLYLDETGRIVNRLNQDQSIDIRLSKTDWQHVSNKISSLKKPEQFQYIDFDEDGYEEYANWIVKRIGD